MSPPFSLPMNKTSKCKLARQLFSRWNLLGLFFYPQDGSDMFPLIIGCHGDISQVTALFINPLY
jgi:hypothetical protein